MEIAKTTNEIGGFKYMNYDALSLETLEKMAANYQKRNKRVPEALAKRLHQAKNPAIQNKTLIKLLLKSEE